MADNKRTLTINVRVDSSGAIAELNKIRTSLSGIANGLNTSRAFNSTASGANNATRSVRGLALAQNDVRAAADRVTASQRLLAQQQAVSSQMTNRFGGVLGTVVNGIQRYANTTRRGTDEIKEWHLKMDEARRTAYAYTIAGYQLEAQVSAINDVVKQSVDAFAEFDFAVRRAAGAFAVFETEGDLFKELNQNIQDTAIATKLFDPTEVAKGYYYWGSTTGQVVDATEDLLRVQKQVIPIMQLAAITQSDMEASLKGVYSILQQYDLPMEKANEVTEKLFLVTQKTALEFPDLIESFKMVGPIAASIGVSFEDVIGMLGALGNAGIRGSMAGRALRQTFIKLTDPTVRATKALDEAAARVYGLGTSFEELTFPEGEFVGMQKYLDILNKLTKDLTQAEKNRLLGIITTNNELPSLIKLLDANAKSYAENKKGIIEFQNSQFSAGEASKYFSRAVKNQMESAQAVFGELGNTVKVLAITFGEAVFETIRPALMKFTEALKGLLAYMRQNPDVVRMTATLVAFGLAIATVTAKALILLGAWKLIIVVFKDIQPIAKAASALMRLTAALVGSGNAAKAASAQFVFFNQTTALIDGSMAARGGALGKLSGALGAISRLSLLAKVSLGILATIVAGVGFELLKRHGEALGKVLGNLADIVGTVLNGVFRDFANLIDASVGAIAGLIGGIADLIDTALGGIPILEDFGRALFDSGVGKQNLDKLKADIKDYASAIEYRNAVMAEAFAGKPATLRQDYERTGSQSFVPWDKRGLVEEAEKIAATFKSRLATAMGTGNPALRDAPWMDGIYEVSVNGAAKAAASAASRFSTDFASKLVSSSMSSGLSAAVENMMKGAASAPAQRAAQHSVVSWAAGYVKSFEGTGKEAINAAFKAAQSLMMSKGAENRKVGQAWMSELAKGLQSGNAASVATSLRTMMQNAVKLVNDVNPKMREQGYQIAVAIGNGLKSAGGIDEGLRSQIGNLVRIIQDSGMPEAARQEAVATLMAFLDAFKALDKMAADAWNASRRRMARFGEGMDPGPYVSKYKDLLKIAQDFSGISYDAPETSSGGSGGSGGTKQSPLEKALEVAKNAAEMAQALKSVEGMNVKDMVKKSMGSLAQAMLLADQIVAKIAKQISTSTLQRVADFSEATEKVTSLINSAVTAFASLESYKRPPKSVWSGLAADIKYATDAIGKIASMTRVKMVAQAAVFAEYAGTVIDLLGKGFEAFVKLGEAGYTKVPQEVFKSLAEDFASAVDEMARAVKNIAPQIQKAAKDFSDNAGSTVELIGSGFAAFMELSNYTRVSPDTVAGIVADIALAMTRMGEEAKKFAGKNVLENINKFADTASQVVDSIKSAIEAFSPQKVEAGGEDYTMVAVNMSQVMNQIVQSVTMFADIASSISPKALAAATKVAAAAKEVADAIKGFVEIKGDEEGGDLATFVQQNLSAIMAALDVFAQSAYGRGASIGSNLVAGLASQKAALQAEVNAINAIMASVAGSPVSSASMTTTKGKTEVVVTYNVTGNVSGMTATQVANMLTASNGVTSSAVKQAAGTK